jgi:hypothetical protein
MVGSGVVVAAVAAAIAFLGGSLGGGRPVLLEAVVRTEPPGLPVTLNGARLTDGRVRFATDGPFGVLAASQGCRDAKHRIDPADAGREIVLALDPLRADVTVDPGIQGARIAVNGQEAGDAPATIALDLCRDNAIEVRAEGYRPATVAILSKATPLEARTAAGGMRLEAIPMGRLLLPATRLPAIFLVDGKEVARVDGGMELPAGPHEVRAINAERFVELSATVDVPVGGSVTPEFRFPALARLVVQTFPPNCRVALKRDGEDWRPAGETPLRYEVAPGRYSVRVESPVTGESREKEVNVRSGANPPVRVSFGRTAR